MGKIRVWISVYSLALVASLAVFSVAQAARPGSRFTAVLGGAAYVDSETGLTWQQTPLSKTTSYVAGAYTDAEFSCYGAVIGGKRGWRLPTIQELSTLLGPDLKLPAGHPFAGVNEFDRFWTSSPVQTSSPINMYSLTIGDLIELDGPTALSHFWCVR